jgi:UDP-N-acetylglucosamine 1-carboxyvinyltransferase
VTIPDLRAGFAYVMAGLIASGITTISGVYFLDRGYERIVEKLQSIGARCERVPADAATPETLHAPVANAIVG